MKTDNNPGLVRRLLFLKGVLVLRWLLRVPLVKWPKDVAGVMPFCPKCGQRTVQGAMGREFLMTLSCLKCNASILGEDCGDGVMRYLYQPEGVYWQSIEDFAVRLRPDFLAK